MKERTTSFVEKHQKSKEEIKKRWKAHEAAKKGLERDAAALEKNLKEFGEVTDPLKDPATDKVLCWIRRPTQKEWEEMIPEEIYAYRGKEDEIPLELAKKGEEFTFKLMAELISEPKHDADWWKTNAPLPLIRLFQMHLSSIFVELGLVAENF